MRQFNEWMEEVAITPSYATNGNYVHYLFIDYEYNNRMNSASCTTLLMSVRIEVLAIE